MYLRVTDIMERGFSLGLGVLCLPESLFPLCKFTSSFLLVALYLNGFCGQSTGTG